MTPYRPAPHKVRGYVAVAGKQYPPASRPIPPGLVGPLQRGRSR